ncbi:uncharacterized protein [Procambarus clarkii]|uniref:uncharacterized protein n=1 Tax=Procambarus clarkii TaxID=6728 RepID=UPI0037428897
MKRHMCKENKWWLCVPTAALNVSLCVPTAALNVSRCGPTAALNVSRCGPTAALNVSLCVPTAALNVSRCGPTAALNVSRCGPTAALNVSLCVPTAALNVSLCVPTAALNVSRCVPTAALNVSLCGPTAALNVSLCVPTAALNVSLCGPTAALNVSLCVPTAALNVSLCVPTAALNVSLCGPTAALNVSLCGPTAALNVSLCGPTAALNVSLCGPTVTAVPNMWRLAALTLMSTHLLASGYESDQWPGVQLGAATTSGGCSVPFLPVGDQCLYFATFAELTYEEASQMCHSLDGELAAVLTATRLKNIIDYLHDNGLYGESYWIDGTDRATEGDFRTSSGLAVPMGTPFWTASETKQQPDDTQVNGGEDCMELGRLYQFYINDRNCSGLNAPLCEQSPQLLHTHWLVIVSYYFFTSATPEELDCPPFFVSVGGLCLSFMTWAEETWADARQACHGLSGELAAITDIEQLRAVYLYLHQEGIAGHSFWVGGSDAATEGVWAWTDGHPVTMGSPFWGFVSSNVVEPDGGTAENCILLDAQGYHYFRDASCSLPMTPLCMTLL